MKRSPRDTWLYELRNRNEIVQYGLTNSPNRRIIEHVSSNKRFTHMNIVSVALTKESAEKREEDEIQRYQRQHGGRPPKYNIAKTY